MTKRWWAVWLCVAVVAAGCSSGATPGNATTASGGRSSVPAASPSPLVEVSIGSPTPVDSQSITREQAVQSMLEQLLGEVHAPPGSIELHGAQAAMRSGAALVLDDDVVQTLSHSDGAPRNSAYKRRRAR